MPIDFARVPPRVAVPAPPQLSKPVWAVVLGVVLCLGAALTIFLWPKGRPTNTVWFWFCIFGYPTFAWAFLLCCRLGYLYVRRSGAIAALRISDRETEKCHALASTPLALLGHAWCFSSDRDENGIEGLVDESLKLLNRASMAKPNADVRARWIEIPDRQFHAGNELTEHARHQAVCDWLLARLVDDLAPQLMTLPARTILHIEADLNCALEDTDVRARLQQIVSAKVPALRVMMTPGVRTVWSHGLSPELEVAIKSASQLDGQRSKIDLKVTVGDCGEAGGWLATALAAELAARTGDPQLVLTPEGSDLIALMCRKQT